LSAARILKVPAGAGISSRLAIASLQLRNRIEKLLSPAG
jgi:hypothetical protein